MKKLLLTLGATALILGLGACNNSKKAKSEDKSVPEATSKTASSDDVVSEAGGSESGTQYTVNQLPDWIEADGCIIFAWVWAEGDTGSWHATEHTDSTTIVFDAGYELSGFNLARCVKDTTLPNWEIHDPDFSTPGRVFNQTSDFNCQSGVMTYSAPNESWVEYH